MAFIKCLECKNDISERACFCPRCGCPTEKGLSIKTVQQTPKKYKRVQLICLLIVLIGLGVIVFSSFLLGTGVNIERMLVIGSLIMIVAVFIGSLSRILEWWNYK